MGKIKVGVSACFLGHQVRYDGGHKLNVFIKYAMGRVFELVPICPEVELGLSIPREPIQLERDVHAPRLMTVNTRRDLTRPMVSWIQQKLQRLSKQRLGGMILKAGSPSCGMSVPVHHTEGSPRAPGLFAGHARGFFPGLPMVEGEQLDQPRLQDLFYQNVLLMDRWRRLLAKGDGTQLPAFHEHHRNLLQARSRELVRELERIWAESGRGLRRGALKRYDTTLGRVIVIPPSRPRIFWVLEKLVRELARRCSPWEQRLLHWLIQRYGAGEVDLVRPRALLIHLAEKHQHPMAVQAFLRDHL